MGAPRNIQYAPYPVNYGMIPKTISPISRGGDGDPLDVFILYLFHLFNLLFNLRRSLLSG